MMILIIGLFHRFKPSGVRGEVREKKVLNHNLTTFTPLERMLSGVIKQKQNLYFHRLRTSLTGFTLIELLVVISIIIMVTSMAVIVLPSMLRDEGLKHSARLVRGTFARVRQLASTHRIMHFIVFNPAKGMMTIYRDTNENEEFDKDTDEEVGDPIIFTKGVIFIAGPNGPPLFRLPQPYLGFRSDGSIMLPSGVNDMLFTDPPTEEATDIVLGQKDQPARFFMDFESLSGIIRKNIYKPR